MSDETIIEDEPVRPSDAGSVSTASDQPNSPRKRGRPRKERKEEAAPPGEISEDVSSRPLTTPSELPKVITAPLAEPGRSRWLQWRA